MCALKTFWVVNPASANGQTGRKWPELLAKARSALGPFDHVFTKRPWEAVKLCAGALRAGFDCIVAVGGDGTVNEVVNGFFTEGVASTDACLAVVPRGTGGDFGRTYGWRNDFESALQRILDPKPRAVDLGLVEFTATDGGVARRHFINICSFGVSGLVDREVQNVKMLGGKLSFMFGSVKSLMTYSDRRVRVSLDGAPAVEMDVTTLAVANGRYFGGGMCVAPAAEPSDGLFDVTLWSGYGLSDFVLKSKAIYSGTHVRLAGTKTFKVSTLSAECSSEVLLDVDGEQPGRLPCKISILPGAVRLLA